MSHAECLLTLHSIKASTHPPCPSSCCDIAHLPHQSRLARVKAVLGAQVEVHDAAIAVQPLPLGHLERHIPQPLRCSAVGDVLQVLLVHLLPHLQRITSKEAGDVEGIQQTQQAVHQQGVQSVDLIQHHNIAALGKHLHQPAVGKEAAEEEVI